MLKRFFRLRFFRRALASGRAVRLCRSRWGQAGLPVGDRHRVVYMPAGDDGRWWVVEWTGARWEIIDRCVLFHVACRVAAEGEARSSAETVDLGD